MRRSRHASPSGQSRLVRDLTAVAITTRFYLKKYKDRVFFGSDATPTRKMYRGWWRPLESRDEYIPVSDWWRLYKEVG